MPETAASVLCKFMERNYSRSRIGNDHAELVEEGGNCQNRLLTDCLFNAESVECFNNGIVANFAAMPADRNSGIFPLWLKTPTQFAGCRKSRYNARLYGIQSRNIGLLGTHPGYV
jgi:hypothetical protein